LKAIAVVAGVVGACIIAVAMMQGPLSAEPSPGMIERFTIFAYPMCMLLAGIFAAVRVRIALIYSVMALAFAVAFVIIHLSGEQDWDTFGEKVVFALLVTGPALIMTSLSWSVMRASSQPVIPTRLG
jgi:hypothetical protein